MPPGGVRTRRTLKLGVRGRRGGVGVQGAGRTRTSRDRPIGPRRGPAASWISVPHLTGGASTTMFGPGPSSAFPVKIGQVI